MTNMDLLAFLLGGALLFVLGAVAGVAAAASQDQANVEITRSLLLGFAGAGYSGADFFGGLLKRAP